MSQRSTSESQLVHIADLSNASTHGGVEFWDSQGVQHRLQSKCYLIHLGVHPVVVEVAWLSMDKWVQVFTPAIPLGCLLEEVV